MAKPIVAVIGRPNVGKSTFFNYLAGKRISIVENTPGVTRDRIYAECEWLGRKFILIDTGGIVPFSENLIMQQMKAQAEIAIETADIIVFMVDMKDGVTATDIEVGNMLRKTKKPVLTVVNKVDKVGELPSEIYEFYNLGMGDIHVVSSVHGLGIGDLLDKIYENFPKETNVKEDENIIKIAVIGKPNVGKSTLINKLIGEERVIVSEIPGTTRDAIDTYIKNNDKEYMFIDTAGIRRQSKIKEKIEKYSILRALTAIERADVCLIMIDAQDGVCEQDKRIAGFAHEAGKASIIVVNKWDSLKKETGMLEKYKKEVRGALGYMQYSPIMFISAMTGQRVKNLYENIEIVFKNASKRISTGFLNDILNEAILMVQPPSDKGKRLKVYYVTQAKIKPPTFVLFINKKKLMHYSYQRYIENQFRKNFGFEGTPIHFIIREKEGVKSK